MTDAANICSHCRRRILLVEDDYLIAHDLACELQAAGVAVVGPVPDIQGAVDLLDAGPAPDAAILDINLGGVMVYPLADILRNLRIPFVFVTGYGTCTIPERYRCQPRLEKPVALRGVAEALGL